MTACAACGVALQVDELNRVLGHVRRSRGLIFQITLETRLGAHATRCQETAEALLDDAEVALRTVIHQTRRKIT